MKKIILVAGLLMCGLAQATPGQCYKDAKADPVISADLSAIGLIKLCSGATSSAPVKCYNDAKADPVISADLSEIGLMKLCSANALFE